MVFVSACSMDVCGHMTIQHGDTIDCIKRNWQTGAWWAICRWTGGENKATSTIQGYFSLQRQWTETSAVHNLQTTSGKTINPCLRLVLHPTFFLPITILEPSLSLFAFSRNGLIFFSSIKLYFHSNNLQCNILTQCHFENTCFNLCTFYILWFFIFVLMFLNSWFKLRN